MVVGIACQSNTEKYECIANVLKTCPNWGRRGQEMQAKTSRHSPDGFPPLHLILTRPSECERRGGEDGRPAYPAPRAGGVP